MVLINKCHKRIIPITQVNIMAWNGTTCKLHDFIEHLCYLMCSWLTLCLSVERLLMLKLPLWKYKTCNGKKSVALLVLLFLFLAYTQTFRLIYIDLIDEKCTVMKQNQNIYLAFHVYTYQILLQFLLPNSLIILCNFTILFELRSNWRRLNQYMERSSSSTITGLQSRKQHDLKTTRMLVVITFLHEVTILPILILTIVFHLSLHFDISVTRTIYANSVNLKNCLELLSEVTFSVNFYIYVLWGRQLRRHVKQMFCS